MRATIVPPEILDANVESTSVGDRLIVTAWRSGYQVTDELEISGFTTNWDNSRYVHGHTTLVIADPDGVLWPRNIASALAPGGSRLKIAYRYGATRVTVPLGWWRIRKTRPEIRWQYRRIGSRTAWLPGGGTVTVQADEELCSLYDLDRLDIGERHSQTGSVLGEVERLAAPYMPVVVDPSVVDAPIGRITYEDERRLVNIQFLLDRIGATYRMDGQGNLEIVPATGTPTDWGVAPGESGTLISLATTMSDADLVNGVTSWVELDDDERTLLTGRARLLDGPLAVNGPFGRVLNFRGANLATTQAQVDLDAATTLARLTAQGDVILSLESLAHPGLQIHDRVRLVAPEFPDVREMVGRVQAMTLTARDGVIAKSMPLQVALPHDDLFPLSERLIR